MNKSRKSINRIVFINILSTILAQGLAFFTAPIFSRVLGTKSFGVFTVFNTWASIVSVVFTLESSSTLVMARTEYPLSDQEKYQSSMVLLSACSFAICSAIVLFFGKQFSKLLQLPITMIVVILLYAFFRYVLGFLNAKFTYEFKAEYNLALSVLTAVSTIVLSLILIPRFPQEINYWGRILGLSIPYIIIGIVVGAYVLIKGKFCCDLKYWRFAVRLALPIVAHMLSNTILSQSDRVMLQWFDSDASVGIYSLAFAFSGVLSVIWNALNNSWVPFFYEFMRNEQYDEVKVHAKNYLELFSVLTIGFALLETEVYHLYAPKSFWEGTTLILIFTLGNYLTLLYSFPVNYEFFHKKTKIVAVGTAVTACLNLILNYLLLKAFGVIGVALATTVSVGFKFTFHYLSAKYLIKSNEFPFSFGLLMKYLLIVVACIAFTALNKNVVIVRWCIGVVLGIWELLRIKKRKAIF